MIPEPRHRQLLSLRDRLWVFGLVGEDALERGAKEAAVIAFARFRRPAEVARPRAVNVH